MKNLDFKAVIFLVALPLIAFVIGCLVFSFQGMVRWALFAIGLACVFATAIYSVRKDKIKVVDGGTFGE